MPVFLFVCVWERGFFIRKSSADGFDYASFPHMALVESYVLPAAMCTCRNRVICCRFFRWRRCANVIYNNCVCMSKDEIEERKPVTSIPKPLANALLHRTNVNTIRHVWRSVISLALQENCKYENNPQPSSKRSVCVFVSMSVMCMWCACLCVCVRDVRAKVTPRSVCCRQSYHMYFVMTKVARIIRYSIEPHRAM